MDAYIYNAGLYCGDCGEGIRNGIEALGKAPEKPDDPTTYDSGDFPKGPYPTSFEEWAGDFGYDSDSRRAEATYNACVESAKKLKEFLGEQLFSELVYKVERL